VVVVRRGDLNAVEALVPDPSPKIKSAVGLLNRWDKRVPG
jgi:hypothetical protein